ncbi:MAG: phosphoglycerate mutase [Gammaproteobacteria bacterium]|nr:phosphoglycerate mutase [Gammaproteobacteria bacterium]
MSELYLIRHAQASFGAQNYDQLSDLGIKQSRLLGEYLSAQGLLFDHVITGSLNRQAQTVMGIRKTLSLPSIHTHLGFDEYPFQALSQSYTHTFPDDDLVQQLIAAPTDKKIFFRLLKKILLAWSNDEISASETWQSFQRRVYDAKTSLQELAGTDNRVLVVSSGGAICQFIGSILELSPERTFDLNLQMRNASISRMFFNQSSFFLSSFNGVPHLENLIDPSLITYA